MSDPKLQEAIQSNPCGMCKAMGLPACKGHEGGGGGGDVPESSEEKESASDSKNTIDTVPTLVQTLDESTLWGMFRDEDEAFLYQNPNSLFNLSVDIHNSKLTFSPKEDLSPDEKGNIAELFEAIKQEFADFSSELAQKGVDVSGMTVKDFDGKLELKFPNPELQTEFVGRLMQKNLFPTQMPALDNVNTRNQVVNQEPETENTQSSAPNPFDISQGPKPSDRF